MSAAEEKTEKYGRKALLPGDPFPWAPRSPSHADPEEEPGRGPGEIHTPADSSDLASFDIGGGD